MDDTPSASFYVLLLPVALALETLSASLELSRLVDIIVFAVAFIVLPNLLLQLHRRFQRSSAAAYLVVEGVLLSALILLVMRDHYGAALLAAFIVAMCWPL